MAFVIPFQTAHDFSGWLRFARGDSNVVNAGGCRRFEKGSMKTRGQLHSIGALGAALNEAEHSHASYPSRR